MAVPAVARGAALAAGRVRDGSRTASTHRRTYILKCTHGMAFITFPNFLFFFYFIFIFIYFSPSHTFVIQVRRAALAIRDVEARAEAMYSRAAEEFHARSFEGYGEVSDAKAIISALIG